MRRVQRSILLTPLLFLAIIIFFQGSVSAINFHIKPVRIFFDTKVKTEKLIIGNLGNDVLTLQIKVYKWSQNAKGEDLYEENTDIIIFPKIFTIKKGEEKIIRVGTNLNPGVNEKTYRIYIEEVPAQGSSAEGATVRILTRAGVPLFISPVKSDAKGKIESFLAKKGKIEAVVKNNGNLHFIINSIKIKGENPNGKEIFTKELGGWYLLNGTSRLYTTPIPQKICKDIANLSIEVKTDKFKLEGKLDVDKTTCLP